MVYVWYIFTYMKTIKSNTFMLGKDTVRPMDTMGYAYLGKSEHVPTPSSRGANKKTKGMVN